MCWQPGGYEADRTVMVGIKGICGSPKSWRRCAVNAFKTVPYH